MSGLLSDFIKKSMELGIPIKPVLDKDSIVIEISEREFYEAVTRGLSEQQKKAIQIRFVEGKMIIRVKLW